MSGYVCPLCGSKIDVSTITELTYCPFCKRRILVSDVERGNLSIELISSLSGSELDEIIKNMSFIELDKLELASRMGSVKASIEAGSYYLKINEYKKAKMHFDLAANRDIPDGKYASMVCSLETDENLDSLKVLYDIKQFNDLFLYYLSQETINKLKSIIDDEINAWKLTASIANAIASAKSIQPSPETEPEYQRYIPPDEESTETREGIMGCGVTGTFWGMGYNS